MMYRMTSKWARLGEKLRTARVAHQIGVQQAADAIGIKRGALWNIERGEIARVTPTIRAYAQLLGWSEESIEAVLAGGEPTGRADGDRLDRPETDHDCLPGSDDNPQDAEPGVGRQMPSDLSVRIQRALGDGPLLDARVAEVVTPTGLVKATIVIRGESGISSEDLLAALESLTVDVRTESD